MDISLPLLLGTCKAVHARYSRLTTGAMAWRTVAAVEAVLEAVVGVGA